MAVAIAEECGAADRFTGLELSAPGRPGRRRAPRHAGHQRPLADALLQLVLQPGPHVLLDEVGRRHGAHARGRGHPARPVVAARVDPDDRGDAAAPADRRRRVDRLARPVAALPRAVGLSDGSGLHLREGLRLGAARVSRRHRTPRPPAGPVRGGQVARRRRVRPLAHGRRGLHQHPPLPQAARVRGRRGDPLGSPRGARRPGPRGRPARRPHHRPRHPRPGCVSSRDPLVKHSLPASLRERAPRDRAPSSTHPLDGFTSPEPLLGHRRRRSRPPTGPGRAHVSRPSQGHRHRARLEVGPVDDRRPRVAAADGRRPAAARPGPGRRRLADRRAPCRWSCTRAPSGRDSPA